MYASMWSVAGERVLYSMIGSCFLSLWSFVGSEAVAHCSYCTVESVHEHAVLESAPGHTVLYKGFKTTTCAVDINHNLCLAPIPSISVGAQSTIMHFWNPASLCIFVTFRGYVISGPHMSYKNET